MKERILVIEDSRTQAAALLHLLTADGYRVEVAGSGEEGIRWARTERFDLVLSDILLPGLNGYDLCRQIKAEPATFGTPRVVLLTSLGDPVYIIRGLESGADNYLVKPYRPERLLRRIRQILQGRSASRGETTGKEVAITFLGEQFTIGARSEQILDFFLSSFEELIETNRALQESKESLQQILAREKTARRSAEAATIARDLVLATVSHDLRNPLNTILMSTGLIFEFLGSNLDPKVRERVDAIARVADQMRGMIDDLLDTATIEAGGFSINCRVQDPIALAREEAELLAPIASDAGLILDTSFPDELPSIHADGARIRRVIANLLGNAIKFTPPGGTVGLGVCSSGTEVIYSVGDTGPGIPEQDLPRIFERFWRGNPTVRGGVGLGLSLSKWVVEAHGGRIWVESEIGRGTSFFFTIPLA